MNAIGIRNHNNHSIFLFLQVLYIVYLISDIRYRKQETT